MQKFYDNSTKSHKNRKRNMADKVLIVDDDISICKLLEKVMHSNELDTEVAGSGKEALELLKHHTYDVILMDIMLGDMEGFDVIKELRASGIQTPVMIVSGRNEDYDSLYGLSIGADDYITKPFGMMEFVARVKAVLRRCARQSEERELHCKGLRVNVSRHEVSYQGEMKELTRKEFELLEYLLENKGLVMSRNQILCHVWGYDFDGETRTVDVHVRTLRQKLGEAGNLIETVRGVGYRIGDHL